MYVPIIAHLKNILFNTHKDASLLLSIHQNPAFILLNSLYTNYSATYVNRIIIFMCISTFYHLRSSQKFTELIWDCSRYIYFKSLKL